MEVPRGLAYLLAWGAATTLTVGASWLGINSVLSSAAPARTSPLSAAELRRAAPTSPAPSPTPVRPAPSALPPVPATASAPPTATASRPPVSRPPSPTPSASVWLAEPDGRGGTAYRRTFRMQGGEATIWFARGEIRVLTAAARPGFGVDIDRPSLDSTTVSFSSGRHRSQIWATWRNGPYAELNEGR